jgi:predicted GNAT family N-acyltransferase
LAERPVTTKVVETAAEFSHVFALRAATFVAEQDCPINEEFDGNDFSAQHIVAYVGDAPAAAIRVRYFHSFAKWERFCILPRFRKSSVRDEILSAAEEIVRRKGFNQIYFQAEAGLGAFWERRGFRRRGERVVRFSGREYGEFIKAIAASTNAITLEDDPLVLNRVEGKWHKPGILDRSSERLGA